MEPYILVAQTSEFRTLDRRLLQTINKSGVVSPRSEDMEPYILSAQTSDFPTSDPGLLKAINNLGVGKTEIRRYGD